MMKAFSPIIFFGMFMLLMHGDSNAQDESSQHMCRASNIEYHNCVARSSEQSCKEGCQRSYSVFGTHWKNAIELDRGRWFNLNGLVFQYYNEDFETVEFVDGNGIFEFLEYDDYDELLIFKYTPAGKYSEEVYMDEDQWSIIANHHQSKLETCYEQRACARQQLRCNLLMPPAQCSIK